MLLVIYYLIAAFYVYFLGDKIASQAAGADFYRKGRAVNLGFYLNQVGFPCPPGAVLGVAHLVAGRCMFSANFAGSRHSILPC